MSRIKDHQQIERNYRLKAVIDVGSTSIRMVVAQFQSDGQRHVLDTLNQSVAIGSDTFSRGRISRRTTEECVKVLRSFSAVMKEYGIDPSTDARAVATSAVREARNRDEFIDRIYIATGINVEVIEGTEVNRLTFLGIQPVLQKLPALRSEWLLVAEVGGGSTELLGLEAGRVAFAHTYRLGAYRLREYLAGQDDVEERRVEVLEMEIEAGIRQCRESVEAAATKPGLLLMGGEARLAVHLMHNEWDEQSVATLRVVELAKLAEQVLDLDPEEAARRYKLSFEEAEALGPALKIYVQMAKAFGLKKVHVCGITLRDGLLAEAASGSTWSDDFVQQVLSSAREIGRKYQLDFNHAECVTKLALTIFDTLNEEHRLDRRYRVILTVAGLLHDVGMFIGSSSHHKHSRYLILNSDLFGLGEEDVRLVAMVARYHRRAVPGKNHSDYQTLPRDKRLAVSKLSAILRVADSLDRSHAQAIRSVKVVLRDGEMRLQTDKAGEFMAEKRALAEKGRMFEQVYGRTVSLRAKRRRS